MNMTKLVFGKNTKTNEEVSIDSSTFGSFAQRRIQDYNKEIESHNEREKDWKKQKKPITTTKIRGILDLINKIFNRVMYNAENQLSENQLADIAYLKIKLAYECGRDIVVKDFVEKTFLMNPIDEIVKSGNKNQFLLYARYVESLVAYFKYYDGKD